MLFFALIFEYSNIQIFDTMPCQRPSTECRSRRTAPVAALEPARGVALGTAVDSAAGGGGAASGAACGAPGGGGGTSLDSARGAAGGGGASALGAPFGAAFGFVGRAAVACAPRAAFGAARVVLADGPAPGAVPGAKATRLPAAGTPPPPLSGGRPGWPDAVAVPGSAPPGSGGRTRPPPVEAAGGPRHQWSPPAPSPPRCFFLGPPLAPPWPSAPLLCAAVSLACFAKDVICSMAAFVCLAMDAPASAT